MGDKIFKLGLPEKAKQVIGGINKGFNKVADVAEHLEHGMRPLRSSFRSRYRYSAQDNIAIGMGKAFIKAGAIFGSKVAQTEYHYIKSIAEFGAKISGGRKSP